MHRLPAVCISLTVTPGFPRTLERVASRQGWGWWLIAGGASGAALVGTLAPVLFLLDTFVQGHYSTDDLFLLPWVVILGIVWGAAGGLLCGATCAVVTTVTKKRRTRARYARDAAVVTGLWATAASATQLADEYRSLNAWDVFVWLIAPVGASVAVACLVGGWVGKRVERTRQLRADDGSVLDARR